MVLFTKYYDAFLKHPRWSAKVIPGKHNFLEDHLF